VAVRRRRGGGECAGGCGVTLGWCATCGCCTDCCECEDGDWFSDDEMGIDQDDQEDYE